MRVMFVGSLSVSSKDVNTAVEANLQSLLITLITAGHQIVIRNPSRTDQSSIPIDEIVYAALKNAYQAGTINLHEGTLTVIMDIDAGEGFQVDLPHQSYSVSASYRIDFYRQILDAVDMIIGVGGKDGLVRLAMLCEYQRKPIFFLPGAGGSADMLWREYFTKSYQIQYFSQEELRQLRSNHYINKIRLDYGPATFELIQLVYEKLHQGAKREEIITVDRVDLREFIQALRRFSLGVWLTVFWILASLISFAYWLGTINFIAQLTGFLNK